MQYKKQERGGKEMKKRLVSVLCAVAVLSTIVVGCSGGSGDKSDKASSDSKQKT